MADRFCRECGTRLVDGVCPNAGNHNLSSEPRQLSAGQKAAGAGLFFVGAAGIVWLILVIVLAVLVFSLFWSCGSAMGG
jgi:hypothetical protein